MQKTVQKPKTIDPDFELVMKAIAKKTPSEISRAVDNVIGKSTIANWRKNKVRRPQHYTMQAALRAVGKEFRIGRIRGV